MSKKEHNENATRDLKLMAASRRSAPWRIDPVTSDDTTQVLRYLADGADINVTEAIWQSDERECLLTMVVNRPLLGLLFLERGAVANQGLVDALAKTSKLVHQSMFQEKQNYAHFTLECAKRFPHLNWYAPGYDERAFYKNPPASMLIEDHVPGFNDTLETAQAKAGLPVGSICRIETREDRIEAIRDLASDGPRLYWMGERSRVEVLRELMREDVDPNFTAEFSTAGQIKFLEFFLLNQIDTEVVRELVARGAEVADDDLLAAALDSLFSKDPDLARRQRQEAGETLLFLLTHTNADMERAVNSRSDYDEATLGELLRSKRPDVVAEYERRQLERGTSALIEPRTSKAPRL